MKVACAYCGVSNWVTRENWKCRKCSRKQTTILVPKPIIDDEEVVVFELEDDETEATEPESYIVDPDTWEFSEEKTDDREREE